ncbi:SIMPL domain-containing protein [Variovorax sp. RHLX14]|uniref:SIMPL domain-containing protein n=1 Tax=unclassified Variovorax TaxID=663243 RepID=UPI003F46F59F
MFSRHILAAGFGLLALLGAGAASAQLPGQISVSGSAAVRVAPDEVFLTIGVESRDANLQTATRDNSDRVAKALALIKQRYGIPEKNVQLNFIQVEPEFDSRVSRTVPVAYRAHKSIGIKITRLDTFEPLLTDLYGVGVNQVENIEFRNSDMRKHRDKARELAAVAAREKADALTSQLGVKRGKAIRISENSGWNWGGWSARYRGDQSMMQQNVIQSAPRSEGQGEGADGDLSVGQISVTATINVDFQLE